MHVSSNILFYWLEFIFYTTNVKNYFNLNNLEVSKNALKCFCKNLPKIMAIILTELVFGEVSTIEKMLFKHPKVVLQY